MTDTFDIEITKTSASKISEVDFNNLPFGKIFSDHMLMAEYKNGAWQKTQIMPFGNISLSPATSMIHYGQSIFEGMKAFRADDDEILVFRPDKNMARLNQSAERMCMPEVPKEIFMDGLKHLLSLDRNWVPNGEGSSLYIRPFLFATDAMLGVKPSESYVFMIITAPVGPYYSKPLHLKIETKYTRAALGGVGFAKAAGNYGAAMYPAMKAQENGIDQLIWTDAKEHRYLEEAGTMNMMVVIDNTLITPPLTSTILPGVTRESFLQLSKKAGYLIEERPVSVNEVITAIKENRLQELFGVGTAATTAQVERLTYEDETYILPSIDGRTISNTIGKQLIGIKKGVLADPFGWNVKF
ncbi:MAG: branched-chain amino acid aminotransferase [Salibacteraceae bacterium]